MAHGQRGAAQHLHDLLVQMQPYIASVVADYQSHNLVQDPNIVNLTADIASAIQGSQDVINELDSYLQQLAQCKSGSTASSGMSAGGVAAVAIVSALGGGIGGYALGKKT